MLQKQEAGMTTSQDIKKRADNAAEAVAALVNKQFSHSAPSAQVTQATERLQNSFLQLAGAFVQSMENAVVAAPQAPSLSEGFEEAKLLESIEKWQTRYRDIEEEFDTFKEQYDALTRQYNQLVDEYDVLSEEHAAAIDTAREKTEAFAVLSEATAHVSDRLDSSINRIDVIIEEGAA